jgi:hypothetical protein
MAPVQAQTVHLTVVSSRSPQWGICFVAQIAGACIRGSSYIGTRLLARWSGLNHDTCLRAL